MDAHTEKLEGLEALQSVLPERNMRRVQEGVEAYKRDRENLLKEKKMNHVVAYSGPEQVAMARTHGKLQSMLLKIKDLKRSDLFITCVSPPDTDDDVMMSR